MTEKRKRILNLLTIAGFSLYFIILFSERLAAVILSPTHGAEYALSSGHVFNYLAYSVTALSLVAGTILFLPLLISVGKSIRTKEEYLFEGKEKAWCVAATVLLIGGMMHTGFTLAGVQFAAYGFLIGAMVVRCVKGILSGEEKRTAILSVIYVTLFSMSIPVCYYTALNEPMRSFFFLFEFAAVFCMVPCFGALLYDYMQKGRVDFDPFIPTLTLLLSGGVIALNWQEEINYFVLVFASLTLLFYLTFGLYLRSRIKLSSVPSQTQKRG